MATRESGKGHKTQRGAKKLGRGKKINEVKPLEVDYFRYASGIKS